MKSPTPNGRADTDLERLLSAIVEDDRVAVGKMIKLEPQLCNRLVNRARPYQSKIHHWLYVNDSPLHLAAAGHRVVMVRMLLAGGADANLARNHRQSRPLHYAADGYLLNPSFDAAQQVKTIRCLLDAGADLHAVDKNGATALHRAVRTRCAAAVECLLDAGADPTARNRPGATPFHLAAQNTGRGGSGDQAAKEAQRRIIELMLERGVRPAIKDARGKSVLDWARSEWVRRLLSNGARSADAM